MDKTQKEPNKPQVSKDATPKGQEPSSAIAEPSPTKDTSHTYTQEELDRAIKLGLMDAGRERKIIEMERDNLKSQLQTNEGKLTDIQDELGKLEKRIEELASNDPELTNLEKRAKTLREQELTQKNRLRDIEVKEHAYSTQKSELDEINQAITVWQIAETLAGGDEDKHAQIATKLADVAQSLGATTEDKIQAIAVSLWGSPVPEKSIKPYSGITGGGTGFTRNKENPDETLTQGFKSKK